MVMEHLAYYPNYVHMLYDNVNDYSSQILKITDDEKIDIIYR